MTARRELRLAVLLCLVGSAVVLLAVGRTWLTFDAADRLTIADAPSRVAGTQVLGLVRPLGLVGLAGVLALAATRSWGRIIVGALVAASGAGVVIDVALALHRGLAAHLGFFSDGPGPHEIHLRPGWAVTTLLGGVLMSGAGLLVAVRGRRWAALSSSYEVKGEAPPPATDKGAWDALDRGDDPTV